MDPDSLPSPDTTAALQELELAPPSAKTAGFNKLLSGIISTATRDTLVPNLIAYGQALLSDTVGIVSSRPLIETFVLRFRELDDADIKITVGKRVLELLAPKVVSYEEQDMAIKETLADAYQSKEAFIDAARILQTIPLDSSQRTTSADDKAAIWVRIVRCYLEADDAMSAMAYLNRAKTVMHAVTDSATRLQFRFSQARIYDSQCSFLEASTAYHQISNEPLIDAGERLRALSAAIVCAVLAPAGPLRARTLAGLCKDERTVQLDEHAMLEKIFHDRLLAATDVDAFAARLAPHQRARTADGSTVLDKAVLEHNLLAASRLYANIGIDQLAELLHVDPDRAEAYAAHMIQQHRLVGYIDQVARYIYFLDDGGLRSEGQPDRPFGVELRKWDDNVRALAEEVECVHTLIQSRHPDFCTPSMAV